MTNWTPDGTDTAARSSESGEHIIDNLPVQEPELDRLIPPGAEGPVAGLTGPLRLGRPAKKPIRVVAAEHRAKTEATGKKAALIGNKNIKSWVQNSEESTSPDAEVPASSGSETDAPHKIGFKWVKGDELGQGTYRRVYLALNCTTGEMLAAEEINVPRRRVHEDKDRLAEAVTSFKKKLSELHHTNVVSFIDIDQADTPERQITVFYEYIPGSSISKLLTNYGAFEEKLIRSFTGNILAGLEYLHDNGIIFGNLEAKQILVSNVGTCKISGYAPYDTLRPDVDQIPGDSVFYASPEYIHAARQDKLDALDERMDTWSVGCILLEMRSGRRPWDGFNAIAVIIELFERQRSPPIPQHINLSSEGHGFLQACFKLDLAARSSVSELRRHPFITLAEE